MAVNIDKKIKPAFKIVDPQTRQFNLHLSVNKDNKWSDRIN